MSELVDHQSGASAKAEVLALLWQSFKEKHLGPKPSALSPRGQSFRRFELDGGKAARVISPRSRRSTSIF